jgi:hypothetical protein
LELFRQALIAVAPLAERAGVNCRQEPPYDDWEVIEEGLFDGMVRSAVESSAAATFGRLPRYGFRPVADSSGYLQVSVPGGHSQVFLRFASANATFSRALVIDPVTDEPTQISSQGVEFSLRLADGTAVSKIEVVS